MSAQDTTAEGFTEEERAAIRQRAAELRTEARRPRGGKRAADELDVLDTIQKMSDADRPVAERIHAIVTATAPDLAPRLWYGQPAYARDGKVVCFFRSGDVDKERYSTFGFTPEAGLDDEAGVWATSFAVPGLTAEGEALLTSLVRRATAAR